MVQLLGAITASKPNFYYIVYDIDLFFVCSYDIDLLK